MSEIVNNFQPLPYPLISLWFIHYGSIGTARQKRPQF
ncbi:Uncharacterised protein [Klebsiella pneumoniae]|nr:Uncharacterised protein [Klebsiella pneumoniae]SVM49183.1 Uncharacterised protein [Klebsiella pneumoniae]